MSADADTRRFEALVLPWLDAGYNLARWLLHDESAADDVLQEASLRAFRHLHTLRGGEAARPWFLAIVRNACFNHLQAQRGRREQGGYEDDALESLQFAAGDSAPEPAAALHRGRERALVDQALRALAPAMREVIVLRELEGLSYTEIAQVAAVPLGTVMSRLSRARSQLKAALMQAGIDE